MSDCTVDQFYYIFDSREQRALVVDRRTGEEVVWRSIPRVQLIEYVAQERSAAVVRQFAHWCARQTGAAAAPVNSPTGRLWSATQEEADAWAHVRTETTEAVVQAAALDLPRRCESAARLLTAHACTHPDAIAAAVDAAHMSERWAEFQTDAAPEEAVRDMQQRQIDWLLDVLGAS